MALPYESEEGGVGARGDVQMGAGLGELYFEERGRGPPAQREGGATSTGIWVTSKSRKDKTRILLEGLQKEHDSIEDF